MSRSASGEGAGPIERAWGLVQQRIYALCAFHQIGEDEKGVSRELDYLGLAKGWLQPALEAHDDEQCTERGPHWLSCRACARK